MCLTVIMDKIKVRKSLSVCKKQFDGGNNIMKRKIFLINEESCLWFFC